MGSSALGRLFPYVFGFLREQWLRFRSRKWQRAQGVVESGSISQSSPIFAELVYRYSVGQDTYVGRLSRECFRRKSAEDVVQRTPGTFIEVRYDPKVPDRSYAPLPLGWGGFLLAAFPVCTAIAAFGLGIFAGLQTRYLEKHFSIDSSQWHPVHYAGRFSASIPGNSVWSYGGYDDKLAIDATKPMIARQVTTIHNDAYFYVEFLQYPDGTDLNPSKVFAQIRSFLQSQNSKRYIYVDRDVNVQGRSGKEYQFTRPYATVRAYVDRTSIYIIGTDWYVDTDEKKFLDSFQFIPDELTLTPER